MPPHDEHRSERRAHEETHDQNGGHTDLPCRDLMTAQSHAQIAAEIGHQAGQVGASQNHSTKVGRKRVLQTTRHTSESNRRQRRPLKDQMSQEE